MEEIKVGEYIRTKEWGIAKVHKVDNGKVTWVKNKNNRATHYFTQLKEPSKDLIELIEVGDYVNGLKITLINEPSIANCYKRIVYAEDEKGYLIKSFSEDDIKSIVTKEMYASIEYEVIK